MLTARGFCRVTATEWARGQIESNNLELMTINSGIFNIIQRAKTKKKPSNWLLVIKNLHDFLPPKYKPHDIFFSHRKDNIINSLFLYVFQKQEPWTEASQERLDLQRARVQEVNRHLTALADSWEHGGFPFHMNLAVRHHGPMLPQYQDALVNRLKIQNRQLSDEVHHKNERIATLEMERKAIYRDVMQQQRLKNSNFTGNEEVIF